MKKYLTIAGLFLMLSCGEQRALIQQQNNNLQQIESNILAMYKEKEIPKDSLPAERITIELNDRTLYANWVSNDSSAPTFFITHGNGETLSDWRPLQAYLLSKGYSSFVFDYIGFGSSTGKPSAAILNEDAIEAYKTFATLSLNAQKRIAFSHSLGGGNNNKLLKLENVGHNIIYENPTDTTWSKLFDFINDKP